MNVIADPRVSLVIPALNEAENLPFVFARIPQMVDEVLIVDGHSTDGTLELAQRLRPDVRVVIQDGHGKGNAITTGVRAATGDIVVMLDADGSTDPSEIPAFVGALMAGADFAKGSRFLQGGGTDDMSMIRRLGNRGLVWLVRVLFGSRYSDLCYGYNAFWRTAVTPLGIDHNGFEIETALNVRALRAGLHITEVPSHEYARRFGTSHLCARRDGIRVLRTIVTERLR